MKILGRDARGRAPDARLVLPFEMRCRSRFLARLESGETLGVIIARGSILRGGDMLQDEDGRLIGVEAAAETVSTASSDDEWRVARAAYHLGNRHTPVQIGPRWLRYGHDHVLDGMVIGLGLRVEVSEEPFEPEPGAYAHGDTSLRSHVHQHP